MDLAAPWFDGLKLVTGTGRADEVGLEFDPVPGASKSVKYFVYYAPAGKWSWDTATKVGGLSVSPGRYYTHRVEVGGLTPKTEYIFGIKAEDSGQKDREDLNEKTIVAAAGMDDPILVVVAEDVFPSQVETGESNVVFTNLELRSDSGTAVFSRLEFTLGGTADPGDIAKVKVTEVVEDAFGKRGRRTLGSAVFDEDGKATIDLPEQAVFQSTPRRLSVLLDIADEARVGAAAKIQVKLKGRARSRLVSAKNGEESDIGDRQGVESTQTSPSETVIVGNKVFVKAVDTAPAGVKQGRRKSFLRLTLSPSNGFSHWAGVRLKREGTSSDKDIGKARIFKSTKKRWSASAKPVGAANFINGLADVRFKRPEKIVKNNRVNYFVVLRASPLAKPAATVGVSLDGTDAVDTMVSERQLVLDGTEEAGASAPAEVSLAEILDTPDKVRVKVAGAGQNLVTVPTTTRLVPLLAVGLVAETKDTTWTAIKVKRAGSAPPNRVNQVYVYRSSDERFDPTKDSMIGRGEIGGTVALEPQLINSASRGTYFVVADINNKARAGEKLGGAVAVADIKVSGPDVVKLSGRARMLSLTPNPHSSASYCNSCHQMHQPSADENLLKDLSTMDPDIVNSTSAAVYEALCFSCHDGSASALDIKADYDPGLATPRQKGIGDISGPVVSPGHMTDQTGTVAGGYLPSVRYNYGTMMPCMVCHDVHFSTYNNPVMLADSLYEYASGTTETTTNTGASYYWDSTATIWGSSATDTATRRSRCEVCHRNHVGTADTTGGPGTGSYADGKSVIAGIDLGRPASHAPGDTANRDSLWCGECHGVHKIEVPALPGEGETGNVKCDQCHTALFDRMRETSSYHHYMQNAEVSNLPSSGSKYPTKTAFTGADDEAAERRCLTCHVDHDIFSPATNPDFADRGKNLRASAAVIPSATDPASFTDTDFDAAQTDGGLCLSCHKVEQTKNVTKQSFNASTDGSVTPIVGKSLYNDSAPGHNYEVTATFPGSLSDTETYRPFEFRANCSKCHDTLGSADWDYDVDPNSGSKQNSRYKFALHSNELRRLLAWLNITPQDQTQDPLEESQCIRCHSRAPAAGGWNPFGGAIGGSGYDYYNQVSMPREALDVRSQFLKTYTHPIGGPVNTGYRERHRPIEGLSANWLPVGSRHVECEDCHNPHASRRASAADTPRAGMNGNKVKGPQRGVWGVAVSGTQFYNTGRATFTNGNTAVTGSGTAWSGTLQPGWYIKNDYDIRGRWYKIAAVNSNTSLTLAQTYDGSNFASGFPGTLLFGNVDYTAANVTYSRVAEADKQYEICMKCHSSYAYDDTAPSNPGGSPSGSPVRQTDIGLDYNPNQYANHPIEALGKNQPITASGQAAGAMSYYNSNWPKFSAGTVSVDVAGSAVFSSSAPSTVIPGWYVYIGASTPPSSTTVNWYQVTAVGTPTNMTLTPPPGAALVNQPFALTAGLGNTFVPPAGPWGTMNCSDCHRSEKDSDSLGPHGSNNKWLLREATSNIPINWYNGTSVISVNTAFGDGSKKSPSWTASSPKNLCFNCHRRDVYGDFEGGGEAFDNPNTASVIEARMGRVPHDVTLDQNTYKGANKNSWGIICFNCHGGDSLGGIHASSAQKGIDSGGANIGASFRGRRFLNGATWAGVTRATVSNPVTCWTKRGAGFPQTDEVNDCKQSHAGSTGTTAIYDYGSAAD